MPILFALALLSVSVDTLHSAPIGGSNVKREYWSHAPDLGKWSVGVFAENSERTLISGASSIISDAGKTQAYVGYDFTDWLMVYGGAGNLQNNVKYGSKSADPIYTLGLRANILSHLVPSPGLFEDNLTISATMQYSRSEFDFGTYSTEWDEIYTSVIVSIVNDLDENKLYWPDSIALFIGPVYSNVSAGAWHEDHTGGYTAGLEIFFSQCTSMHLGILEYDEPGIIAGLHVSL